MIAFEVQIRTRSEANRSRNEHWATTRRHVWRQRDAVSSAALSAGFGIPDVFMRGKKAAVRARVPHPIAGPVVVTLTRIAPRKLDVGDNDRVALKHVRDEVASIMRLDDNDPRIEWQYAPQEQRGPGVYAVRIEIRARRSA